MLRAVLSLALLLSAPPEPKRTGHPDVGRDDSPDACVACHAEATPEVVKLGALLVLDLLLPRRLFCRALCPAGAVANYLRTPRTLRIAVDRARCSCLAPPCHAACAWGVDPRSASRFDGCTSCLACLDACPSGAVRATFRPAAMGPPPAPPQAPPR